MPGGAESWQQLVPALGVVQGNWGEELGGSSDNSWVINLGRVHL